jgi:signal transduction histidine kinase
VELLECLAPLVVLGIEGALLRERTIQQQRHLDALKRKREDMLSVIAHEFRTPLGVIQATADLIVGGKLSPDLQARSAARLSASVQRLTRLVSDIRTSQTLVSRPLEVTDEKLLVTETCNQVVRELAAAAAEVRRISLVSAIPDGIVARGDNALFAVALRNIVHNAIRFTPDGGRVEVRGSPGLGMVVLEVQDTGVGIAPEEREAIFERFYEAGSAITHSSGDLQFKSGGLGLGLATAKAILDGHRASLEIESRPGEGSTFRIRLPVR